MLRKLSSAKQDAEGLSEPFESFGQDGEEFGDLISGSDDKAKDPNSNYIMFGFAPRRDKFAFRGEDCWTKVLQYFYDCLRKTKPSAPMLIFDFLGSFGDPLIGA